MEIDQFLLDYEWTLLAPELTILITATVMSIIDLFMKDKADRRIIAWLGMVGIVIAGLFIISVIGREPYQILADTYRMDGFANVFKLIILGGTGLILLAFQSAPDRAPDGYARSRCRRAPLQSRFELDPFQSPCGQESSRIRYR